MDVKKCVHKYTTVYTGVNFFRVFYTLFIPLTAEYALRALIDFTLSNARRFYPSMGNPLDGKGLFDFKLITYIYCTENLKSIHISYI